MSKESKSYKEIDPVNEELESLGFQFHMKFKGRVTEKFMKGVTFEDQGKDMKVRRNVIAKMISQGVKTMMKRLGFEELDYESVGNQVEALIETGKPV